MLALPPVHTHTLTPIRLYVETDRKELITPLACPLNGCHAGVLAAALAALLYCLLICTAACPPLRWYCHPGCSCQPMGACLYIETSPYVRCHAQGWGTGAQRLLPSGKRLCLVLAYVHVMPAVSDTLRQPLHDGFNSWNGSCALKSGMEAVACPMGVNK